MGNHHAAKAGRTVLDCMINGAILLLCPGEQSELPQAADFRSGNHQGIECGIGRNTHRHLAAAETAVEVKHNRQAVVVIQAGVQFEGRHAGFAVNQRPFGFLIVNVSAVLVDDRVQDGCISRTDVREIDAEFQAVALEGR